MLKRALLIFFVLIFVYVCAPAGADEKKLRVAILEFANGTPKEIPIRGIMKVVNGIVTSLDVFELVSEETLRDVSGSKIWLEAMARGYDAFSAARLARELKADALMIGTVNAFEKNTVPQEIAIKIDGYDMSRRGADVILSARLLGADGAKMASASGSGRAEESALEHAAAFVSSELSEAFKLATAKSALQMCKGLEEALSNPSQSLSSSSMPEPSRWTIVKADGAGVYMNAGLNRSIFIGDIFLIFSAKNDAAAIASARLVELSSKGARLEFIGKPKATVSVGDRAEKKIGGVPTTPAEPKPNKKKQKKS